MSDGHMRRVDMRYDLTEIANVVEDELHVPYFISNSMIGIMPVT